MSNAAESARPSCRVCGNSAVPLELPYSVPSSLRLIVVIYASMAAFPANSSKEPQIRPHVVPSWPARSGHSFLVFSTRLRTDLSRGSSSFLGECVLGGLAAVVAALRASRGAGSGSEEFADE